MDISFKTENVKFNYRACAVIIDHGKILAMQHEPSPYFSLPGGRVNMGETAEHAVIREVQEELKVTPKILRPLWLNQSFFRHEKNENLRYHELCIYFLMDISHTDLLSKGQKFSIQEKHIRHTFEWLEFERLKTECFYPVCLKEDIFHLPETFTLRTESE